MEPEQQPQSPDPINLGGRPSKYRPEFAKQAKALCQLGATDRELAEFFEVSEVTLNSWKILQPRFLKSLKLGKASADERVVRSLYQRAVGYSHPAVKIFCSKDGDVTEVPFIEHHAPDPTSCIFWLKNRRRDEWRDRQDHELSGKDGGPLVISRKDAAL